MKNNNIEKKSKKFPLKFKTKEKMKTDYENMQREEKRRDFMIMILSPFVSLANYMVRFFFYEPVESKWDLGKKGASSWTRKTQWGKIALLVVIVCIVLYIF